MRCNDVMQAASLRGCAVSFDLGLRWTSTSTRPMLGTGQSQLPQARKRVVLLLQSSSPPPGTQNKDELV